MTDDLSNGALAGLNVLDFTHYVAGPYCTKLLADYGANVVKVEPPAGDGARRLGPFPGDTPHPEKSGLFLHLNTNKRSLAVNLKAPDAATTDLITRLAQWADIVVENYRPGVADRLGIGYPRLRQINPALIYTSISNFGQTGPYRDYRGSEIVFYAMGGEMHSTGLADREPLKLGGNVGLYQAGSVAATATLGAVLAGAFASDADDADGNGDDDGNGNPPGQQIDVSIMETQLGSVDRRQSALLAYQYTGELSHRPASGGSGGYPNAVYPCADGYFQINGSRMYFPRTISMLGNPPDLTTPRWQDPAAQGNPAMQDEFESEHFLPWTLERTRAAAWQAAQAHRVLSGPINTMADLDVDPSFNARGVFAETNHPAAGPLRQPGRPFMMDQSPWQLRRPAPLLGQHTAAILTELGYKPEQIDALAAAGVIILPSDSDSDTTDANAATTAAGAADTDANAATTAAGAADNAAADTDANAAAAANTARID